MTAEHLDRIRGCLIGGAVGDALGAPVEFWSLEQILAKVGERGVRDYLPVTFGGVRGTGLITDDTQMTLFTVEGIIRMELRATEKGIGPTTAVIHRAYWRWWDTQTKTGPGPGPSGKEGWLRREKWLYSQRAPGLTCMSALEATRAGDPFLPSPAERITLGLPAANDSKGCGAVMRSAPFGFLGLAGEEPDYAWWAACESAAYTHGHPTGQHAAGALAVLIWFLCQGQRLETAVEHTVQVTASQPGTAETRRALESAVLAARSGRPGPQTVESLGGGWVAEEALAIGVYAALCFPGEDQVRDALALAVTHSGDSDSTGSICGNILGTLHGITAIPADLAVRVEGRPTILQLADDLWYQLNRGYTSWATSMVIMKADGSTVDFGPQDPFLNALEEWWKRYPGF